MPKPKVTHVDLDRKLSDAIHALGEQKVAWLARVLTEAGTAELLEKKPPLPSRAELKQELQEILELALPEEAERRLKALLDRIDPS